jgi:hypothetical protein
MYVCVFALSLSLPLVDVCTPAELSEVLEKFCVPLQVNAQTISGNTPLHFACIGETPFVVRYAYVMRAPVCVSVCLWACVGKIVPLCLQEQGVLRSRLSLHSPTQVHMCVCVYVCVSVSVCGHLTLLCGVHGSE